MASELWARVREKYPIEQYLEFKGIAFRRNGQRLELKCPLPGHDDSSPSFHVYADNSYWCYGCGSAPDRRMQAGGSIIDLYAHLERTDPRTALVILADSLGLSTSDPEIERYAARVAHSEQCKTRNLGYEQELTNQPTWSSYLNKMRGITAATVNEFQLGVDKELSYMTIPLRDEFGHLVEFILHHPKGDAAPGAKAPKYVNPPKESGFDMGGFLFNCDKAGRALDETNDLYVVEGIFDAMSLWQAGYKAVVALCGGALSAGKVTRLLRLLRPTTRVIFIPDCDKNQAGIRYLEGNVKALRSATFHPIFAQPLYILDQSGVPRQDIKDANDYFAKGNQTELPPDVEPAFLFACRRFLTANMPVQTVLGNLADLLERADAFELLEVGKLVSERLGVPEQSVTQYLTARDGARSTTKKRVLRSYSMTEAIHAYLEQVDHADECRVYFGFQEVDDAMRGLMPGDVFGLLGRSNTGKTLIATDAIIKQIRRGRAVPTLIFSLEMKVQALVERFLAQFTRSIDGRTVEEKIKARDPEMMHFVEAFERACRHIRIFDSSGLSTADIERMTREVENYHFGTPVRLLLTDHLQMIVAEGQSEYQKVSNAIREYKQFNKEADKASILLMQTSRMEGGHGGEPITMSSIRDSGVVEETVDQLGGIWVPALAHKHAIDKLMSSPLEYKESRHKVKGSEVRVSPEEARAVAVKERQREVMRQREMMKEVDGLTYFKILKSRREGVGRTFVYKRNGLTYDLHSTEESDLAGFREEDGEPLAMQGEEEVGVG